jgi:hypothetical protein
VHRAARAVEHAHGGDRLGHLLAVRADVLDRRGADRPGDAGQALHARQAAGHAVGDERIPWLAGGDLERGPVARDAAGGDPHHGAREALVGDHDVRPAGEHEQRIAGPVGRADGVDEGLLGGGLEVARGGAAEAQGGELAQAQRASG